jgi:DNA-directed RNA polymerase beta' subunit
MGLMTAQVIRGTSVCNVRAGYTRDRPNSILAASHGIDDDGHECTTCNSSDFSQCPTHFGHMELPTDDFAYVHFCVYLHRLLNVTCPLCSRLYMASNHTAGTGAFRMSPESAADQIHAAFCTSETAMNTDVKVNSLVMYSFSEFLAKIPLPGAAAMDESINHHSYAISCMDSARSTDLDSATSTIAVDCVREDWIQIITHLLPILEPCAHWSTARSRVATAKSRSTKEANISCQALAVPVAQSDSVLNMKGKTKGPRAKCNQLALWAKNIQAKLEVLPTWQRLLIEPSLVSSEVVHRQTSTHLNNNWWRVLLRAVKVDAFPVGSETPMDRVATLVKEIQLLLDSRHWPVYKSGQLKTSNVAPRKWLLLVRQVYHLTGVLYQVERDTEALLSILMLMEFQIEQISTKKNKSSESVMVSSGDNNTRYLTVSDIEGHTLRVIRSRIKQYEAIIRPITRMKRFSVAGAYAVQFRYAQLIATLNNTLDSTPTSTDATDIIKQLQVVRSVNAKWGNVVCRLDKTLLHLQDSLLSSDRPPDSTTSAPLRDSKKRKTPPPNQEQKKDRKTDVHRLLPIQHCDTNPPVAEDAFSLLAPSSQHLHDIRTAIQVTSKKNAKYHLFCSTAHGGCGTISPLWQKANEYQFAFKIPVTRSAVNASNTDFTDSPRWYSEYAHLLNPRLRNSPICILHDGTPGVYNVPIAYISTITRRIHQRYPGFLTTPGQTPAFIHMTTPVLSTPPPCLTPAVCTTKNDAARNNSSQASNGELFHRGPLGVTTSHDTRLPVYDSIAHRLRTMDPIIARIEERLGRRLVRGEIFDTPFIWGDVSLVKTTDAHVQLYISMCLSPSKILPNFLQNVRLFFKQRKKIDSMRKQIITFWERGNRKNGYIRECGTGKRVNHSFRAVLGSDSTLKMDECLLGGELSKRLFKRVLVTPENLGEVSVYMEDVLLRRKKKKRTKRL